MFVFISIEFTKSIFDIVETNPDYSDIVLPEKDFAKAWNDYEKRLKDQMRIEVEAWIKDNLKRESVLMWVQDSGSESIEFEVQIS